MHVNAYSIAANCERIADIGTQLIHLNERLQVETNQYEIIRIKRTISELKEQIQFLSTENTNIPLASIIKNEIELMEVPSDDFVDAYGSNIDNNSDVRICNIVEGNHQLCGIVLEIVEKSKEDNGALYADASFYDGTGILECRISSYYYPKLKSVIYSKALLCILGNYLVTEYGNEIFWIKDSYAISDDID